jgi:hypothetical protein
VQEETVVFNADSVMSAVSVAFAADADLTALCPGGAWHERGPDEDHGGVRPFATCRVQPKEKQYISDRSCVQTFVVQIDVYGNQDTATTGKIADTLCAWDVDTTRFAKLQAKVVGFFPTTESLGLDTAMKKGENVVLASKAWALVLHYTIGSH